MVIAPYTGNLHRATHYICHIYIQRLCDEFASFVGISGGGGDGEREPGCGALLISQPAVSKQLRQLEQSLNTKLVDRHPKGIGLTEAGRVLNDYAWGESALAEAKIALEDLSLNRGSLSTGAADGGGLFIAWGVGEFRRRFRWCGHVETEGPEVLEQRLADGVIQFGLSENEIAGSDLEVRRFMSDVLVPVASFGHRLARKRSVSIRSFFAGSHLL